MYWCTKQWVGHLVSILSSREPQKEGKKNWRRTNPKKKEKNGKERKKKKKKEKKKKRPSLH
jgi:hypothetical protein